MLVPIIRLPLLLLLFGFSTLAWVDDAKAQPTVAADVNTLLEKLDSLYRSESSKGVMSMTVVTAHYTRTLKMEMVTRGQDDTLIRILSPRKEKGVSTLKRGNEMWNYLPKIKKVIRIPASMMGAVSGARSWATSMGPIPVTVPWRHPALRSRATPQ